MHKTIIIILTFSISLATYSSVTHQEFNQIEDSIYQYFEQIADDQGGILIIDSLWEDNTVNAFAQVPLKKKYAWIINLFGGLARVNTLSADGFTAAVCHEVGHFLGGYPKSKLSFTSWASSEGQADYFAFSRCLKKIWNNVDNQAVLKSYSYNRDLLSYKCQHSERPYLCQRIILAGNNLIQTLFNLSKIESSVPSLLVKSDRVVDETLFDQYPSFQCRLDTVVQGAICNNNLNDEVSDDDPYLGYCNNQVYGSRPKCWFNKNFPY